MYQGIKCVPSHIHIVTAVGVTWALTEALVHLNPAGFDLMCRPQSLSDVLAPDVSSKAVVTIVRHPHDFRFIVPWYYDEDGAKYFLAREAPVV